MIASIAEADAIEELHCAAAIQSALREHWQKYVLERRKLRKQVVRLEDEPDLLIAVARGSRAGKAGDLGSADNDFTTIGTVQCSDEVEQRGLAGSGWTDEQRELHHHTVEAQKAAFESFRTAQTCSDVDKAVLAYLDDNGIRDLWRQHTGHGIGLRNHEAPFLDEGDHTSLEPGMVFTI